MPEPPPSLPLAFQLRVVLRGVSPLIWRRILVRSDSTIADLHTILQLVFGWSDEHLHRFVVHGRQYGISYAGGLSFRDDPHEVRLADLGFRAGERFLYEYDFTDGWRHDVRVEAILPLETTRSYPVCTGGRRAVPPEDCGGPWGFMELQQQHAPFRLAERLVEIIEAVGNGSDDVDDLRDELEELRVWIGLDRFDRRAANQRLAEHSRARSPA
jgi:hypothetical protein